MIPACRPVRTEPGTRASTRIPCASRLQVYMPSELDTLSTIRRYLLMLFLIGVVGTTTELFLLEHTENVWQWTPLILMGISLLILGWWGLGRSAMALRIFRGTMVLFVLGGCLGLFLHYDGNVEFELEMYPSLSGFKLFLEAIQGATPALAPGTMIGLGLLGIVYTYRHPVLTVPAPGESVYDKQSKMEV